MGIGCIQRFGLALSLAGALGAASANGGPSDGVVIGATKIRDHGPDSQRLVIVLVAEGYRQSELSNFAATAQGFVDSFLQTPPFNTNRGCFNFWRIDVASSQSGADDPATCGDGSSGAGTLVNTYFDATFCSSGLRRLLTVNAALATSVLNTQVPSWDAALFFVNTAKYGGSGGTIAVTSLGAGQKTAIHEFGHSIFGLADEYGYWAGCGSDAPGSQDRHPNSEPAAPNVTVETNPARVKWNAAFYPAISIPTTTNPDCSKCDPRGDPFPGQVRVGLYEGAHYYHCDCYRPAFSCMMRDYGTFCPVCIRRMVQVLQPYQPANGPLALSNPARTNHSFSLSLPTSGGKTYALEFKDSLTQSVWTELPAVTGNGDVMILTDPAATNAQRFYRVRQW